MPLAQIGLDRAWIDGEELELEGGVLLLQRRDPMPGIAGVRSWTANLNVAGYPLADVSRDVIEFRAEGEGREFRGSAYIINTRTSSSSGVEMTVSGTGPLDGFQESLFT